jgi:FAD/FMN-containing dehydrogenase
VPDSDFAALAAAIAGEVILPDSAAYETVRKPAWAQYEHVRPTAVVRCRVPADVAAAIALARRLGSTLATRSGGHCFAGRSTTRGVLIDVSAMCSVKVSDRIATVGAGAVLGDIYEQLDGHGRTIAGGACPTVGVAGLTLGGGLGILGRRYGLTSDRLAAAQVVLADGRIVDCHARSEDELFWALRGAGAGGFGVVTRFVFETVPTQELTCFQLAWPLADAAALLEAWQSWAPDAPDELAASLLLNAFAEAGRTPVATLYGAMLAGKEETAVLLDELVVRSNTDPHAASLQELPHSAAKRYLAENAPGAERVDAEAAGGRASGLPLVFSKSEFFRRPLPRQAIAALVEHFAAGSATGQARELDFTPWGGAYNRVEPHATAFVHRAERFVLKHAVTLDAGASIEERNTAREWLVSSWELAHPYGSGGVFPNFADSDLDDWSPAYYGGNRERLLRIKARYDPENVFRAL